ncbi:MAG TPA: UDP-glucuronic acid decarboxylase family protein [Nitrolancea sp.]|jgi:dTDP-glucose 4,6-dehydratase/UDP-glucuronate decarboxylase|nr:UDP-glucuronic acid decarboxylase family protein [Nitrolancea sp.]
MVAGGAGFIGSHLCDSLLRDGHEVTAADNLVTGRLENIDHLQTNERFVFRNCDVTVPFDIEVDQIYNLASPASPEGYMRHPIETHLVNSVGTLNLLRLAQANGASFLYASTSEAYGDPEVHPQNESYRGNVNPIGPRSCYDESKRFGESITMEFVRQFDLDARIVRIFNTYGPRNDPEDGRVVPNFVMHALRNEPLAVFGDGSQTRSLCYVSDLVKGLRAAMERPHTRGEVINLGNPDERTVMDLAVLIAKLCDSNAGFVHLPERPDDPYKRCPDITKAMKLLDWNPTVDIETGMNETIAYFSRYVTSEPSAILDS